jgi:MtN3 and saliva related transmembrane protein
MKLDDLRFIGWIAATLTSIGFIPQIIKAFRTKSAKDIAWGMLVVTLLGLLFWLSYGLVIKNAVIIAANAFTSSTIVILILLKITYGKKDER